MRISLIGVGAQTHIYFNSESADGAIGFGSTGKAIDEIIEEVVKQLVTDTYVQAPMNPETVVEYEGSIKI